MIEYIPYLLFLSVIFIILNIQNMTRDCKLILVILYITLFSGLRYDVGHDFPSYYYAVLSPVGSDAERFEPFLKFLCFAFKGFPAIFFLFTSFFINYLIICSIRKYSEYTIIPVLSYICIPFFFFEFMCIVRQAMAVSIVFYFSLKYINDGKKIPLIFAIAAGLSCHVTAIAGLLFLLPFDKINWKVHAIVLLGCIMIGQGFNIIMQNYNWAALMGGDYYARYLTEELQDSGKKMQILYGLFSFLNLIALKNSNNEIQKKIFAYISIGACIYFIFSFNLMFSARISRYFFMLLIIAIPYYSIPLIKGKRFFYVIILSFVSLFMLQLYISQRAWNNGKGSKSYMPYKTILFK